MSDAFEDLRQRSREQWESLQRSPRPRILVGTATCGRSAGALEVLQTLRSELDRSGPDCTILEVGCIGLCYAEPIVCITKPPGPGICYGSVTPEKAVELVRACLLGDDPLPEYALGTLGEGRVEGIPPLLETPVFRHQVRRTLRNCGFIDPANINHYVANGGYTGFTKALGLGPEQVIEEIKRSGLRGRGGAGFPTWRKWRFCREAEGDRKYLVSNADEGDPGAFMNRSLLEGDPHALLEGMLIAGYAIGAGQGYIYCRAEYPLALERLRVALRQAEEHGLLGDRILDSTFDFHIKIKEGAGAFVCGEETALIASIEGKRGMPRPRPPFPAVSGLWGKPTIINNVETLASAALVLQNGANWFAQYGTEKSKGTKTFALVGKVKRTGLVEVPLGTTLREMIFDIGGGVLDDLPFKAVQTGGPSGGCIPADLLDTPVDYDSLQAAGTIMGSGGMVVMDRQTCMVDLARYFLDFAQKESCGECVPCRLGTRQLLDILEDVTAGKGRAEDIDLLVEIGRAISKSALCGLGQTAPNPVLTTIRYFRDEYQSHVDGYCPSMVCKPISPAPCQRVCPIGMDVPSYVALIAWGRFEEALDVIYQDNPLPAVCGRICPRPCEANCTRGESDKPLAIRALKRFVADRAMEDSPPPAAKVEVTRPERVAVVGAGPCGLTAAHDLAKLGYAVTVFEARQQPGGMLRHAVPDFRLSQNVVDREVGRIASMIEIRTGQALGRDFTLEKLLSDGFTAVLLAMGAAKGMPLSLEKAVKPKDYGDAVKFLTAVKRGKASRPGRRVVIVGSGHLAMDAARTAVRLGSSRVTVLHTRSRKDLPFSKEELNEATTEGVAFECGCLPVEVITKGGRTAAVRCLKTRPGATRDDTGRRRPKPVEGSEFTIPCDAVICAIGHRPDTSCLANEPSIARGVLDNVIVDPVTMETGRQNVFAAGDVVSCGATVIEAIAAGQRSAAAIHRQLRGQTPDRRFKLPRPRCRVDLYEVEAALEHFKRPAEPLLSVEARKAGFEEAVGSYPVETAIKEAKRCLRCDLG